MSKVARLFAVLVVLVALSVTAGAVFASQPSPGEARAPAGCQWMWSGPGFGWTLEEDGCQGKCPQPTATGTYIGQTELTRCSSQSP
jgi:hypothetical protein